MKPVCQGMERGGCLETIDMKARGGRGWVGVVGVSTLVLKCYPLPHQDAEWKWLTSELMGSQLLMGKMKGRLATN